jgi:hypothetical protein
MAICIFIKVKTLLPLFCLDLSSGTIDLEQLIKPRSIRTKFSGLLYKLDFTTS